MSADIQRLLDLTIRHGGSDLHLSVGIPPRIRVHGRMRDVKIPPLSPDETIEMMKAIAPERNLLEFKERGTTDFAYAYGDQARFRVSCYRQRGVVGLALRLLPVELLSFEAIGLPPEVKKILDRPRGLILVTGPTGSGKTTTLATMVDYLNENFDHHIVTIEDQIEYHHRSRRSIITQRELGTDVGTFAEAMRRALRMDPDVILLGEMRDLDTISAAITAAETGHLVFGTLHTQDAPQTVDRIIDVFPPEQQEQIRVMLSGALQGVLCQQLLKTADGQGRVVACEIMIATSAIRNLIREQKVHQIYSQMQVGQDKFGMQTMNQSLANLHLRRLITLDDAIGRSSDPDELRNLIGKGTPAGVPGARAAAKG